MRRANKRFVQIFTFFKNSANVFDVNYDLRFTSICTNRPDSLIDDDNNNNYNSNNISRVPSIYIKYN